jgi:hypothetical protein
MGRSSIRKAVDRPKFRSYLQVADGFRQAAATAEDFEYWNAAGLLMVHAAIAYTDALTIRIAGVKSQGEDHHEAIALLRENTASTEAQRSALEHLAKIIDHKNAVAYSGAIYDAKDTAMLRRHLDRFHKWVVTILQV